MAADQHDRNLRIDGHHACEQLQPVEPRVLRRVIAGDHEANLRHSAEFHAQLAHRPGGVATL